MIKLKLNKNTMIEVLDRMDSILLRKHVMPMTKGSTGTDLEFWGYLYTVNAIETVVETRYNERVARIYAHCTKRDGQTSASDSILDLFTCTPSPLGGFDYDKFSHENCEITIVENDGSESLPRAQTTPNLLTISNGGVIWDNKKTTDK